MICGVILAKVSLHGFSAVLPPNEQKIDLHSSNIHVSLYLSLMTNLWIAVYSFLRLINLQFLLFYLLCHSLVTVYFLLKCFECKHQSLLLVGLLYSCSSILFCCQTFMHIIACKASCHTSLEFVCFCSLCKCESDTVFWQDVSMYLFVFLARKQHSVFSSGKIHTNPLVKIENQTFCDLISVFHIYVHSFQIKATLNSLQQNTT